MINEVASIATAVAVVVGVVGLRLSQRQRLVQIYAIYIQRYWEILDRLDIATRAEPGASNLKEQTVRSYFQLCEDELELRAIGWIGDRTWSIWQEGMLTSLAERPYRQIWSAVLAGEDHRFQRLQKLFRDGVADEPRPWRRRVRGLTGDV